MAQVKITHWHPTGQFKIKATGSSANHDILSRLAQNHGATDALCFFSVILGGYSTNEHDPNAVAVTTYPSPDYHLLGHLPREIAVAYRARMEALGLQPFSACDAVLSGGFDAGDRSYSFVLELDLDLAKSTQAEWCLSHLAPFRTVTVSELTNTGDGSHLFRAWLPHTGVDNLNVSREIDSWSTPNWDTINYYIKNRAGSRPGIKLLSIPKEQHLRWFGEDAPTATLEALEGRWATVRLRKGAPDARATWQRSGVLRQSADDQS